MKVLDFGIAKLVEASASDAALTIEGMVLGTPAYMAPERFGPAPVDPKADIYSLGVILYQMLEGRRPFVPTGPDLVAFAMMHATLSPPQLVLACGKGEDAGHKYTLPTLDKVHAAAQALNRMLGEMMARARESPGA